MRKHHAMKRNLAVSLTLHQALNPTYGSRSYYIKRTCKTVDLIMQGREYLIKVEKLGFFLRKINFGVCTTRVYHTCNWNKKLDWFSTFNTRHITLSLCLTKYHTMKRTKEWRYGSMHF